MTFPSFEENMNYLNEETSPIEYQKRLRNILSKFSIVTELSTIQEEQINFLKM